MVAWTSQPPVSRPGSGHLAAFWDMARRQVQTDRRFPGFGSQCYHVSGGLSYRSLGGHHRRIHRLQAEGGRQMPAVRWARDEIL